MLFRTLSGLGLLALMQPALANIDIQFDYSHDTSGFFSDLSRQSALNSAANLFETRFSDQLTAITSSGVNNFSSVFFNPSDPYGTNVVNSHDSFAANVIRVYVGGYNFTDNTLGIGGPGGYSCSGFASFCNDADRRGQGVTTGANAVDVAPWGGSISFDTDTNWYFGAGNSVPASAWDFYSVAVHELGHVLGFGASDSFDAHIVGTHFVGAAAGTVALNGTLDHWAEGTTGLFNGASQEAAMTPSIANGTRKHFTDLDFAAMKDIGWQVTPVPEADTWAMMLSGLVMVGALGRRRAAGR